MPLIAPPAIPQLDGSLLVAAPTVENRFHFGNQRIFACMDGGGSLQSLNLAEGVRLLSRHQLSVEIDDSPLKWEQASVFARLFRLSAQSNGLDISLTITCDETSAAVLYRWEFGNRADQPVSVKISHDLAFDLRQPSYNRMGLTGIFQRVLTGAIGEFFLGAKRWKVENIFGEKRKTPPQPVTNPAYIEDNQIHSRLDGYRARFFCSPALQSLDENGLCIQHLEILPHDSLVSCGLITCEDALPDPNKILADAREYAARLRCDLDSLPALQQADALQRSQYAACITTAESMYKRLPSGFAGFWAGPGYAYPPRIYFRDSYWTAQPLLKRRPAWVREHILNLAAGARADGACPSGVIDPAVVPNSHHPGALEWMPNHFDSPAFLILLVKEYIHSSGDRAVLGEVINGRSLLMILQSCAAYYQSLDSAQDGFPAKGQAPNDWADNVLRYPWVTYDAALIYGAWQAMSELQADMAQHWLAQAERLKTAVNRRLWLPQKGWFADYARLHFREEHLALDTLVAIRFGLADESQAQSMLGAMTRFLFAKNNSQQPLGDFGVLCCYPPYQNKDDLFAKSADDYRYHNGAEWPYLSALLAHLLRQYSAPKSDWTYALTRWWQVGLQNGWLTPVEFHSPAYPPGAFLQGWSGLAAVLYQDEKNYPD